MPHSNETTQFIRKHVLEELSARFKIGIPMFIIIWLFLGWHFDLYLSQFATFFYISLSALVVTSVLRLATVIWINKTGAEQKFHKKLWLLQISITLNAIVWSAMFYYIVVHTQLKIMHMNMIVLSLGIGIISPISVSINTVLRITISFAYLLLSLVAILMSEVEGKFVLSILYVILIAYVLRFSKALYITYWQSLINELALSNQTKNQMVLVDKLQTLSQTDGLTSLYNRLYFDQSYIKEWNRACREGMPVAVLLIDVDLFKKINDTLGHSFGDKCLQSLARTLKHSMRRSSDIIARYGGEEFIILMCNSNINAAAASAKRILANVRKNKILTEDGYELNLTCSIGVASAIPQHIENILKPQDLINHADIALYKAKDTGRDKASIYDEQASEAISVEDYYSRHGNNLPSNQIKSAH